MPSKPDIEELSDDIDDLEEEYLIEDVKMNSARIDKNPNLKEDRSSTILVGMDIMTHKKSASSFKDKDTTKNNTDTLPVDGDGSKYLAASSKSYSLSRLHINHRDVFDLKGPISNEIFFSVKKNSILDEYQVGRVLGEGSYGQVKLVLHCRTNMERAMKVIKKAGVSAEERETMMREVSILKSLDHPNILKIFDLYEDDSKLYLITE